MSLPPVNPDKTVSGITVDPRTQDRVVPETRRADGSVRRELKIRPGFTPQEDVSRFRGSRQQQMDHSTLPKGHIMGWTPPSSASAPKKAAGDGAMSKSAKKNEKRREKKREEKMRVIKDSWEDDDDDEETPAASSKSESSKQAASDDKKGDVDALTKKLSETTMS